MADNGAHRRRLEAEDAARLRLATDVQISPNGKLVALTVRVPDRDADIFRSAIWLVDVESGELWQATRGLHRDLTPRWSPDSSLLAFLSDRDESRTTPRGRAANNLYLLDVERGGEARQLTVFSEDVSTDLTYPVISERLCWSPDGREICVSAKNQGQPPPAEDRYRKALVYTQLRYRSGEYGWWDGRRRHLWLIDTPSGRYEQLTEGDWDAWGPVYAPDGKAIAFTSSRAFGNQHLNTLPDSNPFSGNDIWLLDLHDRTPRKLTDSDGPNITPSFSPNGDRIAYFGHRRGNRGWAYNIHLWLRPTTGGEPTDLLADWDYTAGSHVLGDIHDVFAPPPAHWANDGESLYFQGTVRGAANLFRVSITSGEVDPITSGDHEVQLASFSQSGDRFAALISDGAAPADLYVGETAGGSLVRLTDLNADLLAQIELSTVERRSFSIGSRSMDAFVLTPPDYDSSQPQPVVLHLPPSFVQGRSFNFEHQLLAAIGCVVVCPNPPGASSYGEEWLADSYVRGNWFADADDVLALLDRLIEQRIADPRRVGVTGDAYGAMLTNWLITQSDRFAASCERRGGALMWPPGSDRFTGIKDGDEDLYANPGPALERSPLTHVGAISRPHMMIHSLGDTRGSASAGEELFTALKALRREARLVLFRNDHHFQVRTSPPRDRVAFFACVAEWFQRWLITPDRAADEELIDGEPTTTC